MATINANPVTSAIPRTTPVPKAAMGTSPLPVTRLPQTGMRGGRVRCMSYEKKAESTRRITAWSLLAAASVMGMSSPALALVDDRMSTEGTGLSLGLSNNLLGWILIGVFGLIWSLYFVWTGSLEEEEESGLSL